MDGEKILVDRLAYMKIYVFFFFCWMSQQLNFEGHNDVGINSSENVLSRVLPDADCTCDVNIEGSYDSVLWNLDAHIQNRNQVCWDTVFLVSSIKKSLSEKSLSQ